MGRSLSAPQNPRNSSSWLCSLLHLPPLQLCLSGLSCSVPRTWPLSVGIPSWSNLDPLQSTPPPQASSLAASRTPICLPSPPPLGYRPHSSLAASSAWTGQTQKPVTCRPLEMSPSESLTSTHHQLAGKGGGDLPEPQEGLRTPRWAPRPRQVTHCPLIRDQSDLGTSRWPPWGLSLCSGKFPNRHPLVQVPPPLHTASPKAQTSQATAPHCDKA